MEMHKADEAKKKQKEKTKWMMTLD
jgi:hypothetical protein